MGSSAQYARIKDFGDVTLYYRNPIYGSKLAIFRQPVSLRKAIERLKEIKREDHYALADDLTRFEFYLRQTPFPEHFRVKSLLGSGASALCFELENGTVLKLYVIDPYNNRHTPRDHDPRIDLPILEEGCIGPPRPRRDVGRACYYVFPRAETDKITSADVIAMRERLWNLGYATYDLLDQSVEQIGRYQGQLYLLDPQCAMDLETAKRNLRLSTPMNKDFLQLPPGETLWT